MSLDGYAEKSNGKENNRAKTNTKKEILRLTSTTNRCKDPNVNTSVLSQLLTTFQNQYEAVPRAVSSETGLVSVSN